MIEMKERLNMRNGGLDGVDSFQKMIKKKMSLTNYLEKISAYLSGLSKKLLMIFIYFMKCI